MEVGILADSVVSYVASWFKAKPLEDDNSFQKWYEDKILSQNPVEEKGGGYSTRKIDNLQGTLIILPSQLRRKQSCLLFFCNILV